MHRLRRTAVIAMLVAGPALALAGAAGCQSRSADAPAPDSSVVDLQERLLRYMIDEGGDDAQPWSSGPICVGVRAAAGEPPSDAPAELLDRFRGHEPPIHPYSECETRGELPRIELWHVPSDRAAKSYEIGPIERLANEGARVELSYYRASLSAGGWECRMDRSDEGWRVEACELRWIS